MAKEETVLSFRLKVCVDGEAAAKAHTFETQSLTAQWGGGKALCLSDYGGQNGRYPELGTDRGLEERCEPEHEYRDLVENDPLRVTLCTLW